MFDWLKRADRPEVRSYEDGVISQILAAAGGSSAPATSGTAAALAAGWIGRVLSTVRLTPDAGALPFPSPSLADVGRDLVLSGQSLWLLDPAGWRHCLPRPEVRLAPDPKDWLYRVEFAGGGSRMATGSNLAHFRWATDARDPARGLSPIDTPAARFAARLEQALEGEAGSSHGYVLGMPATAGGNFEKLKSAVRTLKGRTLTIENDFESSGHSLGVPDRKLGLFAPVRFGFDPPETLQKFLELSVALTLESCGLPSQMILNRQEGMAGREALRRTRVTLLQPLMVMIVEELGKAGAPHKFSFTGDLSNDLSTRARSFASLVRGGMAVGDAVAATGLLLDSAGE